MTMIKTAEQTDIRESLETYSEDRRVREAQDAEKALERASLAYSTYAASFANGEWSDLADPDYVKAALRVDLLRDRVTRAREHAIQMWYRCPSQVELKP